MARPTKEQRLAAVHEEARRAFDAIASALLEERRECLKDRRFCWIPGAQWEGLEKQFENKPRFEVNKIPRSVTRIIDEYRNNRIGVAFESRDGVADDQLADTCAALHRSDEQDSSAEEAYDNAFDEAVTGGIGAWRLRARYEDEDEEEGEDDADEARPQRIRIEAIHDADSCVFFDLNSKRQDHSDARFCFVLTSMTRDEYKRQYDDDPATWPKPVHQHEYDWSPPNAVVIAEYYLIEDASETTYTYQGIGDDDPVEYTDTDFEDDPELERTLEATGYREVSQTKSRRRQVHKYLMNGQRVLDDCGVIAGRQIPVVVTYGKRFFIDNKERCMGQVRLAKDAQRILNMMLSKLGEIASLSSVKKPVLTPKQIAGHEHIWANENTTNFAYLLLNPLEDASGNEATAPLQWTDPPTVPPAMAAMAQLAQDALTDILGNPAEAEKMVSHVAGKTAELLQTVLDKHAYIFISNMAKAIRRSGQIWLSMARAIYREKGRKLKGISRLKKLTQVELMKPVIDPKTRTQVYANDLSRANLDVAVDIGSWSTSKRAAAVETGLKMLAVNQDPETQGVISRFILMNIDGEGGDGMRAWARQGLVKAGAEKPTPEEAQQLATAAQQQQPSPTDQYALASAEEARAKAQQISAETALTAARTDETKARTIKTLADADLDREQAKVDTAKSLHEISTASLDQALARQEVHRARE